MNLSKLFLKRLELYAYLLNLLLNWSDRFVHLNVRRRIQKVLFILTSRLSFLQTSFYCLISLNCQMFYLFCYKTANMNISFCWRLRKELFYHFYSFENLLSFLQNVLDNFFLNIRNTGCWFSFFHSKLWIDRNILHDIISVRLILNNILLFLLVCSLSDIVNCIAPFSLQIM